MLNSSMADIQTLKSILRSELSLFCSSNGRLWKQPVVDLLREIQAQGQAAVFFGGTLRSLLTSRLLHHRPGRPRDIDMVIGDCESEVLRKAFQHIVKRETRFGGLQLESQQWQFDLWPLEKTWAFVEDKVVSRDFAELPSTTFLNLEAIAVQVWPERGKARVVYSGDEQFFHGILNQTVEVNREANPFPCLCVVRSLLLASKLDFCLGPRLAKYVARHRGKFSQNDYEHVQRMHYGELRATGKQISKWVEFVAGVSGNSKPIKLPVPKQKEFWSDSGSSYRIQVKGFDKP